MENQKNQSQDQSQQQQPNTPQQAPSRQEGIDQSTQAAGGAHGYDPEREQHEVNRERKELDTEESNDSKNPNPSQAPGRGI